MPWTQPADDPELRQRAYTQAYLVSLLADPSRVRRLCGWDWLTDALDALPAASPPS